MEIVFDVESERKIDDCKAEVAAATAAQSLQFVDDVGEALGMGIYCGDTEVILGGRSLHEIHSQARKRCLEGN